MWDNFQLWRKDATVNTQAIVDSEIAAAKGKLDFFAYDLYPTLAILAGTGDENDVSYISQCYLAHAASAHKTDVKFCFILQYEWTVNYASRRYFAAMQTLIANACADPAYMRINGQPLVILYNDGTAGGWAGNVADWNTLKTAIGTTVYGLAISSVSLAQACSLQGVVLYEYNGTSVSTVGRHPYNDVYQSDIAHDAAASGLQRQTSRTAYLDRRTFAAESATAWSDQPTMPEWLNSLSSGIGSTQHVMLIATWDEVAEQGIGLSPSVQEGTKYLDGIDMVKNGNYPSSYTFNWSGNWKTCVKTAGWSEFFPDPNGVQGAHDGDQVISSTTGDTATITLNNMRAADVFAETGPDCGIVEILADAVVVATVDCFAASQTTSAKIATVTFSGPLASHTLAVRVTGTKNASSSSVQIKFDYFKPTYAP